MFRPIIAYIAGRLFHANRRGLLAILGGPDASFCCPIGKGIKGFLSKEVQASHQPTPRALITTFAAISLNPRGVVFLLVPFPSYRHRRFGVILAQSEASGTRQGTNGFCSPRLPTERRTRKWRRVI